MGVCYSAHSHQVGAVTSADELERARWAQKATQRLQRSLSKSPFAHILQGLAGCQVGVDVQTAYCLGAELGRGQYGVVRMATHRATGAEFACKTLPKGWMTRRAHAAAARREVQVLHHVAGHPGVVNIVEAFEDESAVHIIMELCRGGMLFTKINERGEFPEAEAANMIEQIAEVLQYLHSRGVAHRDLKPENILIGSDGRLKVTDFGLAQFVKKGKLFNDVVGSAYYVCPETLERRSGPSGDLWSAGVILYVLLCGEAPFHHVNESGILAKVARGIFDMEHGAIWPNVSESAKDLVRQLMTMDPLERATPSEVLDHPWVQSGGLLKEG